MVVNGALWKPSDLIVGGRYCDLASITQTLQELRAAKQARAVLLLSSFDQQLFRTLLRLVPEQPLDTIDQAQKVLLFDDGSRRELLSPLDELTKAPLPIKQLLNEIGFTAERVAALVAAFTEDAVAVADYLPQARPEPSSAKVAIISIYHEHDHPKDADGNEPAVVPRLLSQLFEQVNGYVAVAVRRVDKINRDQRQAGREIDAAAQSFTDPVRRYHEMIRALLGQVTMATRSDFGMLLRRDRSRPGFDRATRITAPFNIDHARRSEPKFSQESIDRTVKRAAEDRRPFLLDPERDEERFGGPISTPPSNPPVYRMIFPVVQRVANSAEVETISIYYFERDSVPYTAHDLSIARSMSDYYSHLRDQDRIQRISQLLESLTHRMANMGKVAATPLKTHVEAPRRSKSSGLHLARSADRLLPLEVGSVRREIKEAIHHLFELTTSRSVHLRIRALDKPMLHCCAWVSAVDQDPFDNYASYDFAEHFANKSSVNAWVMHHNEAWSEADLAPSQREIPRQNGNITETWRIFNPCETGLHATASFHCEPVRCRGRVIGTLSCESVYAYAFLQTRHVIRAVAAHIGLFLEKACLRNSYDVLHPTVPSELAHRLENKLKFISSELCAVALEQSQGRSTSDTKRIAEDTELLRKMLNAHDLGLRSITNGSSVQEIVSKAHECADLATVGRVVTALKIDTKVEPDALNLDNVFLDAQHRTAYSALFDAMVELFDNCQAKAVTDDFRPVANVELRYELPLGAGAVDRPRLFDGDSSRVNATRSWLRIVLRNPLKAGVPRLSPHSVPRYGRVAIKHQDGAHYGAVRIGTRIREELGGDIYVVESTDTHFAVAIEIPVVIKSPDQQRSPT